MPYLLEMNVDFDTWSVQNAFTRDYFPQLIKCTYCAKPKVEPHLCVYNSGEIVKMQPCAQNQVDKIFLIRYKNYVCSSCFIKSIPEICFVKNVDKCLKVLNEFMNMKFPSDFVYIFLLSVRNFLISDVVLSCVSCSLELRDYKWSTYKKLVTGHRKRRLETALLI